MSCSWARINPYGVDPRYALYDLPANAAGWRLRVKILQVDRRTYLLSTRRHNLCSGKWDSRAAKVEAARLLESTPAEVVLVLLGRKVKEAFGLGHVPSFGREGRFVCLPHPSGLCREWNDPQATARAQEVLREAAPWVPWGSCQSR